MSSVKRRDFVRTVGQGVVLAGAGGFGLPGILWAQSGPPSLPHAPKVSAQTDWNEWEVYYPGQYDAHDSGVLKAFQAQLDRINQRGDVDIGALVSGKLSGTPGIVEGHQISLEEMMTYANTYTLGNPFYADESYARHTKFGRQVAFPLIYELYIFPYLALNAGIGDYMLVSRHNDTHNYYKPYFEGDTIFIVIDQQKFVDTTPAEGSYYRSFAMSVSARYFNQNGELAGQTATVLQNSFRRHKDPAKRNPDGVIVWENPDWWHHRPIYHYTDKDWDAIIALWKSEKPRGATPLYWDDVKVGDQPTPSAIGPILPDQVNNIMFAALPWNAAIKQNVLNQDTFRTMVKNPQGIYVLPEHREKKPADTPFADKELANRDGRCKISNGVAPRCAIGMLSNWMGDAGWLHRVGWTQMSDLPGYDLSTVPDYPKSAMPALFDKYPYLDKVPFMRGRLDTHPMEGDLFISRAYVTGKYEQAGEYFVDLTWWTESFDKYLLGEGFATIKLPKSGKARE